MYVFTRIHVLKHSIQRIDTNAYKTYEVNIRQTKFRMSRQYAKRFHINLYSAYY